MTYWLTEQDPFVLDRKAHNGVWVRPGKENAAQNLAQGDLVYVYEVFRSRDTGESGGAKAVVLLSEVTTRVHEDEGKWIRVAETGPIAEGNCPHSDLLRIIDRKRIQSLGPLNSKLMELDDEQSEQIADYFPTFKTTKQTAEEEALTTYANTRGAHGQGFATEEIRGIIESYSMKRAKKYFRDAGYIVDDRSKFKPYDLCCQKSGEEYFVEVKGTQGNASEILLTNNEVHWADAHNRRMVLFVVHSLEVKRVSNELDVSGGEIRIINQWKPSHSNLFPIAFRYKLPPLDE
jgi:hypothetical protein